MHAWKAVIEFLLQKMGALQQSRCLHACQFHGCICSQVLSIAEGLTLSMDSINVIIVQYAGVFRRSVCLFLLHLCAVWHGGGQKVSLPPI